MTQAAGRPPPPGVIELERRIAAPPETVFAYFTDPVRYRLWQGVAVELDPRPGGIFRVRMNDEGWIARGEYVEVEPPKRVVFTWGWEGVDALAPGESTVEVSLEPDREGTIVRLRHSGLPNESACQLHNYGWGVGLDALVEVLAGRIAETGQLLDLSRADDGHTAHRLSSEPIIWLGTTRPDGRPHVVPVWFEWSDPHVLIFSMARTQKLRNIVHAPFVTLTLDSAEDGRDIVMAEGRAERATDTTPGVRSLTAGFARKYTSRLDTRSFEDWRSMFSEPILVTVSRIVAWTRKKGELLYRSVP